MNPGFRFGQSFVAAEKVLNTRNCTDKTLDNWPKISLRGRKAIGVTGINANVLGQYRDKLCQITMTADVGRSHYIDAAHGQRPAGQRPVLLRVPRVCRLRQRQDAGDGGKGSRRNAGSSTSNRRGAFLDADAGDERQAVQAKNAA